MNLYLMRVCEADKGSDPGLSEKGKRQAAMMAAFMKRQIGHAYVISSPAKPAMETAEIMAAALGSNVAPTTLLLPGQDTAKAQEEIERLAIESPDVLVVAHDAALLETDVLRLAVGAVVLEVDGLVEWIITPALVESTEELIEAARELSESLKSETFTGLFTEAGRPVFVDEAKGEYYYEDVALKRWVLGSGGKSGENCDICQENADMGWIDEGGTFLDTEGGDIDEAPAHPNCDCETETKDTTKRVYV